MTLFDVFIMGMDSGVAGIALILRHKKPAPTEKTFVSGSSL